MHKVTRFFGHESVKTQVITKYIEINESVAKVYEEAHLIVRTVRKIVKRCIVSQCK